MIEPRIKHLLLLEDSEADRFAYRRYLTHFPGGIAQIHEAATLTEALELLDVQPMDALVMDYNLPDGNALDMLKRLPQSQAEHAMAVVVTTGHGSESIAVELLKQGAHDYLIKDDIDAGQLQRALLRALEVTQNRRQREYDADRDALTGAYNRRSLEQRIDAAIERHKQQQGCFALMLLDVDHFKHINDQHGHSCGDAILKTVVQRLQNQTRESDTVARLGGDEFVILVPRVVASQADGIAQKIQRAMNDPVHCGDERIAAHLSMGVALFPEAGTTRAELLEAADEALYEVKRQGRNDYMLFNQTLHERFLQQRLLDHWLPHALNDDHFKLRLEPIIKGQRNTVVGCEAAPLLCHDTLGELSEATYLERIDFLGLRTHYFTWLMAAARQHFAPVAAEQPQWRLNVKLCAEILNNARTMDGWVQQLSEHGIEPTRVSIMLGQRDLRLALPAMAARIQALRSQGFHLILDEFGSGPVDLAELPRLPLDGVKLADTYIQTAASDARARKLLAGIAALASALNIKLIIKGVSTPAQEQLALTLGCAMQGPLFAPLKPE